MQDAPVVISFLHHVHTAMLLPSKLLDFRRGKGRSERQEKHTHAV